MMDEEEWILFDIHRMVRELKEKYPKAYEAFVKEISEQPEEKKSRLAALLRSKQ